MLSKKQVLKEIKTRDILRMFRTKVDLLKEQILLEERDIKKYIVFISISNKERRAVVRHAVGTTLNEALDKVEQQIEQIIIKKNIFPIWIKIDVVEEWEVILYRDLKILIKKERRGFFREGIALDPEFSEAFLECELNSRQMIDYEKGELKVKGVDKLPHEVLIFKTAGAFCDEAYEVYSLCKDRKNFGRRLIRKENRKNVVEVIKHLSQFLYGAIKDDGSFIYGYNPIKDRVLSGYNILRHAGTVWSLINIYQLNKDEVHLEKIRKAISYLLEHHVVYKDSQVAYIVERKNNEIKLGGNGIVIVTLIDYMELAYEDQYKDIIEALGNGILELLDLENGVYKHVLSYPDYTLKDSFRTVYYDGEATFALVKLYGMTKDKKWLYAAQKAVQNFIKNDYTKYRDHWIAYTMNELIKYCPQEEYISFAMKNVLINLEAIYNRQTIGPTFLELLMATFELHNRLKESCSKEDYIKEWQLKAFIDTINYRVDYMLNGYFYPEYAMYFKSPEKVRDTIFIREDDCRIRIDDIQHFLGGYYKYYLYYDQLK